MGKWKKKEKGNREMGKIGKTPLTFELIFMPHLAAAAERSRSQSKC
jgi:hypothetical protein